MCGADAVRRAPVSAVRLLWRFGRRRRCRRCYDVPLGGRPMVAVEHAAGMHFGARLRRLREAAGLTQEALAERAGLSPNAVGALERGDRRHPHPGTLRALADALGLSPEE